MPISPLIQPLLQRLLVAWAASVVTSTAVVKTAENRYRRKKPPKKRRRRLKGQHKRTPPPVLLGTVAKHDAGEPYVPSLTWREWAQAVRGRAQSAWNFVRPGGRSTTDGIDGADGDGARAPDEVVDKDGKKVRLTNASTSSKSASKSSSSSSSAAAAKKKADARRSKAGAGRRRRGQRKQATLFESAKESLRQVVKEEARKAVDEKVEQTGLKGAADALKSASEKVSETAKDLAGRVKDGVPEDFDEKLQSAGKSALSGAKKLGGVLAAVVREAQGELSEQRQRSQDLDQQRRQTIIDVVAEPPAGIEASSTGVDLPEASRAPEASDAPEAPAGGASTFTTVSPVDAASAAAVMGQDLADLPAVVDAAPAPEAAASMDVGEVGEKVNAGVQRLGAFLSGPGNPGYKREGGRVGRGGGGPVVEARDPSAPTAPTAPTAPPSES